MSLGILNQNQNELGKTLQRLSSGQKFNSANGDAASYVISERMLEQIRSLFQDDQNVQNGASLLKTAERGVDQIISNLRTMKEKAIDAANDSNTDEDRRTIQKELDQRKEIINDIAIGTQYNSKILLDGRWTRGGLLSPKAGGGGANTTVENVVGGFLTGNNATEGSVTTSGGSASPSAWQLDVDSSFKCIKSNQAFSVELNFSKLKISNGSYPTALHNQGFTILCGGCAQYINIRFDATKTALQSKYDTTEGISEDGTKNDMAREFIIGVSTVRNAKDLANAIFEGIRALSGQIESSFTTNVYPNFPNWRYSSSHKNTSDDIWVNAAHSLRIRREGGKVFLTKTMSQSEEMLFKEGTIPNPLTDPIEPVKVEEIFPRPIWIQHGTQAGQHTNFYIEDMRSKALGIDAAEVGTREKATASISIIESAIETALDEATNLGAYLQRLEYTGSSISTMRDNVQASESTIRDADMAKEMATYMKYNLLSQSAQSMLAQANQNASSVLGFLQQ